MEDELRMLHDAMVVKDRLRVLAELQATYWEELHARGFDSSIAEQLILEWSRHAYGMVFHQLPAPRLDSELEELLGGIAATPPATGAQPPTPHRSADDPSSVPPDEPWLQLVEDVEDEERDDRAA